MKLICSSETSVDFNGPALWEHQILQEKCVLKGLYTDRNSICGFSLQECQPQQGYVRKLSIVIPVRLLHCWCFFTFESLLLEQCSSSCTQHVSRFLRSGTSGCSLLVRVLSHRWQKQGNSSAVLWCGETKGWHITSPAGTVTSRDKWSTTVHEWGGLYFSVRAESPGVINNACRSQWPRGLRHEMSSSAQTLGSYVRIPLDVPVWFYSASVPSCVGSGLLTGWSPVQGILPIVN
jgi:hypothetical protein